MRLRGCGGAVVRARGGAVGYCAGAERGGSGGGGGGGGCNGDDDAAAAAAMSESNATHPSSSPGLAGGGGFLALYAAPKVAVGTARAVSDSLTVSSAAAAYAAATAGW